MTTAVRYKLVLIFVAVSAFAQTRLAPDQMLKVVWSQGLGGQRVAPNQVRTPALTFIVDPVAASVTVTGGPTCSFTFNQTPADVFGWKVGASLIYIGWWKGQLAVLAGSFDNGVYVSTATKLIMTGDCVPIDATPEHGFPPGLQAIMWVGTYGMPHQGSSVYGTCTSSINSYSMGPNMDPNMADPAGLTSVTDFQGANHIAVLTCP